MAKKQQTETPVSEINSWVPSPADRIAEADGKLFIMRFDKIFQQKPFAIYNRFSIKKGSYANQLDCITQYINYFVKFYDEENELSMAYLSCKFLIDRDHMFTAENMRSMIDFIYCKLFTDSMVEKINRMVEDNYTDDIEQNKTGKYVAGEKKHLESLEFTNEHVKIFLAISFGIKIISPVMFHYFSMNVIDLNRDSYYLYQFYERLFDIFGTRCNVYNKLFIYVKTKVLESKANNELIFGQNEILGRDEYTLIHRFVRKVLVEENMVKYRFNENIIGFNKTIIKFQLMYFLRTEHAKNITEVSSVKNSDGLSGVDKMVMNLSKTDEGDILLAEVNAEMIVDEIRKMFDVPITDEEIQYYMDHHRPSKDQVKLIYIYYAKIFGNCRDCKIINKRQYIIMMLVLKKKLLFDAGASKNLDNVVETSALPYILSGNLEGQLNTRIIRNAKFQSTLDESYLYRDLKDHTYRLLCEIKPDEIDSIISTFTNSSYSYVSYERPDLLGKRIRYSDHKIADEIGFLLRSCL